MPPTVHILILAAGASSRMRGADKLVQTIGGKPILRVVAEVACATGAPVTVTLPPGNAARRDVVSSLPVRIVEIPDAADGMSRSLRRGLAALRDGADMSDGMMILPADMPGFTTAALVDMITRFRTDPTRILRGSTVTGDPGHPAIFPRDLWDELGRIEGDEGGRSVLRRHADRVSHVPLPGDMAVLDLDTPEDWAAYRGGPGALDGQ